MLTVVREAVDNSLDACQEAGILPEVTIRLRQKGEDRIRVVVQDNGPGIVKTQIPKIFGKLLYGSKFFSNRQERGQQGLGISAAGLYAQLTTAKPVIIRSRTDQNKKVHEFRIRIDTSKNEPHIISDTIYEKNFPGRGVYIEMEIEGAYRKGKRSVDEYLKETALANPFAKINYFPPIGGKVTYPRVVNKLPRAAKSIKPHPHGVELGVFERMAKVTRARSISTFLVKDFSRVGMGTAKQVCKLARIRPSTPARKLNHQELEKVWRNVQKAKLMKPQTDCLSPIGEKNMERAVQKDLNCEFVAAITRPPSVYRGNPFGVEVAISHGGNLNPNTSADIVRIANRVPLLYEASSCAITKAIRKINWRSYRVDHQNGVPHGPLLILVHMYSTWIPYTSEGKEAIDAYDVILKEIKLAIQDCSRKLAKFLSGKRRRQLEKQRQSLFEKYIPEFSATLGELSGTEKAKIQKGLEKILGKNKIKEEKEVNESGRRGKSEVSLTAKKKIKKKLSDF